jgi:hypothetical protein
MSTREHRKSIPLGVKLHACLLALGYTDEEITGGGIQFDHCPALALRFVDPETGEMMPAPNDPRHIRPMRKADHARKTFGVPATTAGSDIHAAAKVKRIAADPAGGEEFRRRLLTPKPRDERPRSKWPSRKFETKRAIRS